MRIFLVKKKIIPNTKVENQRRDLLQIEDKNLVFSIKDWVKKLKKVSIINNVYQLTILIK